MKTLLFPLTLSLLQFWTSRNVVFLLPAWHLDIDLEPIRPCTFIDLICFGLTPVNKLVLATSLFGRYRNPVITITMIKFEKNK